MSERRAIVEAAARSLETCEVSLETVYRRLASLGSPYRDALWLVDEASNRVETLRSLLHLGLKREGK